MKYRIRPGEKGEFRIENVSISHESTRTFIAKLVVSVGLLFLVGVGVYAMLVGDDKRLDQLLTIVQTLVVAAVSFYFARDA